MELILSAVRLFPYMAAVNSVVPSLIANQLVPAGVLSFKKVHWYIFTNNMTVG